MGGANTTVHLDSKALLKNTPSAGYSTDIDAKDKPNYKCFVQYYFLMCISFIYCQTTNPGKTWGLTLLSHVITALMITVIKILNNFHTYSMHN